MFMHDENDERGKSAVVRVIYVSVICFVQSVAR